jgi:hypothetical protein
MVPGQPKSRMVSAEPKNQPITARQPREEVPINSEKVQQSYMARGK